VSESKSIILNGQVLHGSDRLGQWRVNQLEGWFDSAPVKNQDEAMAGRDGDFDLPTDYGARPVTMGGRVICTSEEAARAAGNRISGLVRGKVRAQVTDQGEATWADVKLTETVTVKRVGRIVRFLYHLRAPDPRRFGEWHTFHAASDGPDVLAYHHGNYEATPRVTIRGAMPNGYTIWIGGQPTVITKSMATGPYTVDFNDGHLRNSAGTIMVGEILSTSPANIAPGQAIPVTVKGTGTATIDVEVLDTYI
jgi:hypothetical protein